MQPDTIRRNYGPSWARMVLMLVRQVHHPAFFDRLPALDVVLQAAVRQLWTDTITVFHRLARSMASLRLRHSPLRLIEKPGCAPALLPQLHGDFQDHVKGDVEGTVGALFKPALHLFATLVMADLPFNQPALEEPFHR